MTSPRHPSRAVVAAEVRAAMARAGINQGRLIELIQDKPGSMSRTSLSERLNGQRAFNTDHLVAIADVLDIDVFALMSPPAPREAAVSA